MWTLALAIATAIAQEAPGGFDYRTILGGIIGSSPVACVLLWQLVLCQKDNRELRKEIGDLHQQTHQQTLGVAERMAPILAEATRTLSDVRSGLEATLVRAGRGEDDHLDQVMRRLEAVLRDAGKRDLP